LKYRPVSITKKKEADPLMDYLLTFRDCFARFCHKPRGDAGPLYA